MDDFFFFATQMGEFPRGEARARVELASLNQHLQQIAQDPVMGLITKIET